MSVPVNQRGEGVFEVTMKARELAVYTIQICDNKNIFKPEHQSSLTDKLGKGDTHELQVRMDKYYHALWSE